MNKHIKIVQALQKLLFKGTMCTLCILLFKINIFLNTLFSAFQFTKTTIKIVILL